MGVAGLPLMVGDAANALVNLVLAGVDKAAGTNIPKLPSATGAAERMLTRARATKAETDQQRVIGQGMRGASSYLSGYGAGKFTEYVPGRQDHERCPQDAAARPTAAGTGAGVTGEILKQAYPDEPLAELGGSLVGGVAGASLAEAGKNALRVGQALVAPFTEKGERRLVGEALRKVLQHAGVASGHPRRRRGRRRPDPRLAAHHGARPRWTRRLAGHRTRRQADDARRVRPNSAEREAERNNVRRAYADDAVEPGAADAAAVSARVADTRDQFRNMSDQIIERARNRGEQPDRGDG